MTLETNSIGIIGTDLPFVLQDVSACRGRLFWLSCHVRESQDARGNYKMSCGRTWYLNQFCFSNGPWFFFYVSRKTRIWDALEQRKRRCRAALEFLTSVVVEHTLRRPSDDVAPFYRKRSAANERSYWQTQNKHQLMKVNAYGAYKQNNGQPLAWPHPMVKFKS